MLSGHLKVRFSPGGERPLGRAWYRERLGALTKRLSPVVAAFGLLLSCGCSGPDETCTQEGVDGCYTDVGCGETQPCRVSVGEMNRLCECLGDLECDQVWFHEYCDQAPYEEDAGCPLCGE